jgi:hypothetical protein
VTRNVSRQASALAKARERRRALDGARDEQDRRIESATAGALIAIERAAALLELDATEVRRLVRIALADAGESNGRSRFGATVSAPAQAAGDRGSRKGD